MGLKVSRQACSSSDPCATNPTVSGCISDSKLKSTGVGNNKLQKEAADGFIKMYSDMPENIKKSVKFTDGYRPLKVQCNIFDFDHYEKTGKRRKKGTAGTPVATPGSSNHGWGRAIDISPDNVQKWIKENGPKYGWCWGEVKSEPWHFTFCGPGENRDKNCDSFCTGKMTVDISSGSSSDEPTTVDTSTSKVDTIDLLNPVDLIAGKGASDFFKSLGKMFKKKGETANDQQNQNITEDIQRINDIIKKVL
jgi:hypothetical protein